MDSSGFVCSLQQLEKTKQNTGSGSCRYLGAGRPGKVHSREGEKVHLLTKEQPDCAAGLHLGMGGSGGAPRVARFVLLG